MEIQSFVNKLVQLFRLFSYAQQQCWSQCRSRRVTKMRLQKRWQHAIFQFVNNEICNGFSSFNRINRCPIIFHFRQLRIRIIVSLEEITRASKNSKTLNSIRPAESKSKNQLFSGKFELLKDGNEWITFSIQRRFCCCYFSILLNCSRILNLLFQHQVTNIPVIN